jgi:hypothetical protein
MTNPTSSSARWLSNDMARALAAMGPPLQASDVLHAATALSVRTDPVRVIGELLRKGADLACARTIVEALRALHDHAA